VTAGSGRRSQPATVERGTAIRVALEALIAASEEDAATGGPDPKRGIYPNVVTVTDQGYREVANDELGPIATAALERRP